MEPKVGAPLDGVRVHTGEASEEAAAEMGARAFTVDKQVHFGADKFAPGTREGDQLLAHELTHTAQQQAGVVHRAPDPNAAVTPGPDISQPGDANEQEADAVAGGAGAAPGADAKKDEPGSVGERMLHTIMTVEEKSKEEASKIRDDLLNAGGASIGYAELIGLRYPVTSYEAQVSGALTRGSRLDAKGIAGLVPAGFHGIVSFCAENDDDSAPAEAVGLHHLRIPIVDNTPPSEDQVREFLAFVNDGGNQPVYCHCEAGKGRTGVMVACYRMAVEGWSADKAIAEAKSMGMAMPDQAKFLEKFGQDLADGAFSA